MSHAAFSLLARPIQRILWDNRWEQLRPIQVDAIHHVLENSGDAIIAAATAAGKTEAAFLPILSRLHEEPGNSIRGIYVGPLKALINDQFQRMEMLCQHAEIPVHRWHGDVGAGPKRRMVEKPGGVLLITPESIESLITNRSPYLPRLFGALEYVVIDEIHAFVGTERGTHLRSLLYRLERYSERNVRMLGLSATIGDSGQTAAWFGPSRADAVTTITDETQKKLLCQVDAAAEDISHQEATNDETAVSVERLLAQRMLDVFYDSTNLLFANSRQKVEVFADLLNDEARRNGLSPNFLVHHGALSREIREQTEEQMKSDRPTTTVCSPTLELGIDVGSVKAVGQIGPPPSVASLVQRLGRSGRQEGQPSILRLYVREEKADPEAPLPKHLHLDLVQAVAVVELMLEKWIEPADPAPFDLSTATQQVLSVIAETGGATATELYDRLLQQGAFNHLGKETFLNLLRAIGDQDLIEQTSEGELILGLRGEKIVSHHTFYAAFATQEMFQVLWDSQRIGEIDIPPNVDDHLILAGRRWKCLEVDFEKHVVLVKPTKGSKPPKWSGGCGETHTRVREKMKKVLLAGRAYPYTTSDAAKLLESARDAARHAGLASRDIIPTGTSQCYWFPWAGTCIQRTLYAMCCLRGLSVAMNNCNDPCLSFDDPPEQVARTLRDLRRHDYDDNTLLDRVGKLERRKYDDYLSDELLRRSASHELLDVAGARDLLSGALLTCRHERETTSDGLAE